jgi:uncharacterized protein DUF2381
VGWLVLPAVGMAQTAAIEVEREVVADGAGNGQPALLYAAAGIPLVLVFEARLANAGGLDGADVHTHPYSPNALVITPSEALAAQKSAALRVPLVDGVVVLTLVFQPGRVDHAVRVLRRHGAAQVATTGDFQAALRLAIPGVFDGKGCRTGARPFPKPVSVAQSRALRRLLTVCAAGAFSYLRLDRRPSECDAVTARLVRGRETAKVLLLEPALPEKEGRLQILVVSTPSTRAGDYELELLASDGTLCTRLEGIVLEPGGGP